MPVLTNQRWETFAHQRASGVGAVAAASAAGFKSPHVECARLGKHPDIVARIEELRPVYADMQQQAVAHVMVPTRQNVLRDLLLCREEARTRRDLAARMRANELIGKELGMFVTRVDARVDSPLDGLTGKALVALLAALDQGDVEFTPAAVIEHDPLA